MSDAWDGSDRRAGQQWKIKREVSIGDIIAFASAALAVVYAYSTLDKRVTVLEAHSASQREVDRRQDDEQIRQAAAIEAKLNAINTKLDRIIENGMTRR